jgi:hypothetical protein
MVFAGHYESAFGGNAAGVYKYDITSDFPDDTDGLSADASLVIAGNADHYAYGDATGWIQQQLSSTATGIEAVAYDPLRKKLVVCDPDNNQLVVRYLYGLESLTTVTSFDGNNFSSPGGICYVDGFFYVTDTNLHVVVQLDADNMAYQSHYGTVSNQGISSKLNKPRGICSDGQYLYVIDSANGRIVKLGLDLGYVGESDLFYIGTGYGCTLDAEGVLYVVENLHDTLRKFDTDDFSSSGTLLSAGTGNGQVTSPVDVAYIKGYLYVVDATRVQVVQTDGTYVTVVTSDRVTEGIDSPVGVDFYDDSVLITLDGNTTPRTYYRYSQPTGRYNHGIDWSKTRSTLKDSTWTAETAKDSTWTAETEKDSTWTGETEDDSTWSEVSSINSIWTDETPKDSSWTEV